MHKPRYGSFEGIHFLTLSIFFCSQLHSTLRTGPCTARQWVGLFSCWRSLSLTFLGQLLFKASVRFPCSSYKYSTFTLSSTLPFEQEKEEVHLYSFSALSFWPLLSLDWSLWPSVYPQWLLTFITNFSHHSVGQKRLQRRSPVGKSKGTLLLTPETKKYRKSNARRTIPRSKLFPRSYVTRVCPARLPPQTPRLWIAAWRRSLWSLHWRNPSILFLFLLWKRTMTMTIHLINHSGKC